MICPRCNENKLPTEFFDKTETRKQSFCKSCHNKYCTERWIQAKIDAVAYKGGKCLDCSGVFHYAVYDFHHRDPSKKEASWTKLRLKAKTTIKKELDKCDLLCSNCHRLRHVKMRDGLVSERISTP